MARPLKRQIELRQRLDIYLSPDERSMAAAKAIEAGLPLSAYVREAVLARRVMQAPAVSAQRWAELARTCANLNQLTRHINAGTLPTMPLEIIARLLTEVQAVRRELLGVKS